MGVSLYDSSEMNSGAAEKEICSIHAVLFDFGGVLSDEGFVEGLRAIGQMNGIEPEEMVKAGFDVIRHTGWVVGKSDEETFWRDIKSKTGVSGNNRELREIIQSRFTLRPWMMDLLPALRRAGVITAILSDQTRWLDELNDRDKFFPSFDFIFNSYYMGKSKKDPSLFDDLAAKLDLPPDKILFVDDHMGNIQRAAARGFKTIHFIDRENFFRALSVYCPFIR